VGNSDEVLEDFLHSQAVFFPQDRLKLLNVEARHVLPIRFRLKFGELIIDHEAFSLASLDNVSA
jgi:hypothetical protein